jgi:hypothetical protein
MAPTSCPQRARHEPLYEFDPLTGTSIEVFYSDRTLETFGRRGAGWFWWPRQRGFAPDGPAHGPFATSYSAYRNVILGGWLGANLGTNGPSKLDNPVKTDS